MKAVAILALCALALPFVIPLPAAALHEPGRAGRIIVPFGAGSTADTVARIIAERLGQMSGATIVVENRPGADGVTGIQAAKNAPPDGTVLLLTSGTSVTAAPLRDLAPVAQVGTFDLAFACNPRAPFRSLAELTAEARRRPASYAVSGIATLPHLLGLSVAQTSGAQLQVVPFRSSADAIRAVASGSVELVVAPLRDLIPHQSTGGVRLLAKSGTGRSPLAPDVPTMREAGLSIDTTDWLGVFAPASTPPDMLARINNSLTIAIRSPEVATRLTAAGVHPTATSPEQLRQIQQADFGFVQGIGTLACPRCESGCRCPNSCSCTQGCCQN